MRCLRLVGSEPHFVASLVGNFVAFVEINRESSREGAKNGNREWTLIHANKFDGAAWRRTAKIAKIAKNWSKQGG
jgi:hypothetical protein